MINTMYYVFVCASISYACAIREMWEW